MATLLVGKVVSAVIPLNRRVALKHKFRFSIGTLLLLLIPVGLGLVWFDRFRLTAANSELEAAVSELEAGKIWDGYLQMSFDNREQADIAIRALDVEAELHRRAFKIIRSVAFNTIWSEDSPDDDVVRQIPIESLPQMNLFIFSAQASRHRYRYDACVILMDGQGRIVDIEILESTMQLELLRAAMNESDRVPSLVFTYNKNNKRDVTHSKTFAITEDGFEQQWPASPRINNALNQSR